MDRAPLRPIPARPSAPVSDAQAVRQVTAALPDIGAREGLALALVALVGRGRAEAANRVGLDEDGLGAALACARKELRRTVAPLPGSGWCERAERLISDRLDGALSERETRRLDVHLRNCPRCVEHERRLVQATDGLVAGVTPLAGPAALGEVARVEEASDERAEPDAAEAEAVERPTEAVEAVELADAAEAVAVEPADAAEAGVAEPARAGAAAAPPEPAVPPPQPAGPRPLARPLREFGVVVTWHVLIALAVLLAVASLALAVAGLLGADL